MRMLDWNWGNARNEVADRFLCSKLKLCVSGVRENPVDEMQLFGLNPCTDVELAISELWFCINRAVDVRGDDEPELQKLVALKKNLGAG